MRARAQVNGREVGGASRLGRNREGQRAASEGKKFGLESMGCYSKAARFLKAETGGLTPRSRVRVSRYGQVSCRFPSTWFLPESFVPVTTRFQTQRAVKAARTGRSQCKRY